LKHYLALIHIDLKLAFRQRTVIFFNYMFPFLIFFVFAELQRAKGGNSGMDFVLRFSLSIGILGSGLFGAGIRAIQEREMNILRRYKVTPITPLPLLTASIVTGWVIFMPYVVMVFSLAHFVYKMPWPAHMPGLYLFIAVALAAFRAIGLVVASVANSMQEGTILVQLFYFPMLLLSGATIPVGDLPHAMRVIPKFVPSSYFVQGLGSMFHGDSLRQNWENVAVLIVAFAVGMVVSARMFRWEKEEKIPRSSKLWIAAVLLPFIVRGIWEIYSKKP